MAKQNYADDDMEDDRDEGQPLSGDAGLDDDGDECIPESDLDEYSGADMFPNDEDGDEREDYLTDDKW